MVDASRSAAFASRAACRRDCAMAAAPVATPTAIPTETGSGMLAEVAESQAAGRDKGLTEGLDACVIDLVGMRSKDLNGSFATLLSWDSFAKRWLIGVDTGALAGKQFMLKPDNLRVLTQRELDAKSAGEQRLE